jgi:hypothetical protein
MTCNKCGSTLTAPTRNGLLTEMMCHKHLQGDKSHTAFQVFDPEGKIFDTFCPRMEFFVVERKE